ncbi:MAG: hypothetical protein QXL54_03865 [Candidatus Bathyarchaeia archaeon]
MKTIRIRKVLSIAGSKLVCLPPEWIRYVEQKYGVPLEKVEVEADEYLTIKPKLDGGDGSGWNSQ